ncbi:hypothetical protein [Pseudoalteromonas sp. Of7M-16]|uniref:hypothetical protein n=1 Tax=Pseudoalteromonas sp. Of7M-16 TaxID=2917756 RepID=UPI001EF3D88F|nr:hypothetical protein [Pseudoalteromonas sp. Of7M-16]MCG7547859.1 hypothetical protein [Pseudoalteromonas sp. Of7M-16]
MKYIVILLTTLLFITNGFWIFNAIDRWERSKYFTASLEELKSKNEVLLKLINTFDVEDNYDSISKKLKQNEFSSIVQRKQSAIFVGSIVLVFHKESLKEVKLLNELTSDEYDKLEY